ncbi:MAG: acyl-CoA mutase large subunit family protein [Bacteroidales bacterium]|nr:MAG: acyl-CoA mutase large subunit family protein [Bacteroidales bacterium]
MGRSKKDDGLSVGLFKEFPSVPTGTWESQIKTDLKGADYNKRLIWKTIEGIDVKPYYRTEHLTGLNYLDTYPGDFPYTRGSFIDNNWDIRQDIVVDKYDESNKKALHFISRGINSIDFDLIKKKNITHEQLAHLIKHLNMDSLVLNFTIGSRARFIAEFLSNKIIREKIDSQKINGSVDYDPLGELTFRGKYYEDEKKDFIELQSLVNFTETNLPDYRVISIDGIKFNNAGASIIQELGFCLAIGSEYLSKLTDSGLSLKSITKHLQFNFGTGSNYFMEIAKLRAARLLWAKIVEAYGEGDKKLARTYIHCETSGWNKTIYDPYTNILRTTTESMSAILGGTNSLTVKPYDCIYKEPSEFSERIARNIQHILKEESYFNKVSDPCAGSYYVENLTDLVAEKAWKIFVSIEDQGGYIEALKKGYIQSMIKNTVEQRSTNIATRDEILLGTNRFPNLSEMVRTEVELSVAFSQNINNKEPGKIQPVLIRRGAEEFEKLRLQTETSKRGRPRVFMFTYGDPVIRRERSTFSGNFFACGGYEVHDNIGFSSVEEGINEAVRCNPDIVVICSSDDEYAVIAPEIYQKLKNKALIVIAGVPESISELKKAGIEHFIHRRVNIIEELNKYNELLGKTD